MPEAVDVGSVLGGRYKVTGYVLSSAEKDLVLDGVDQVLNRPVSILVASAENAGQVAASAREVATGDRPGNIQVLDLGITEGGTYLVTNRASAPDLLDLIVEQQAAPYIEPFFTDTLGSEIFGVPRSTEPETYEDEDDYEEEYEELPERRPMMPKLRRPRFGRGAASGAAASASSGPITAEQRISPPGPQASRQVPPPPAAPPRSVPPTAGSQRPSTNTPDFDWSAPQRRDQAEYAGVSAPGGGSQRAASRFPSSAALAGSGDGAGYSDGDYETHDDDGRRHSKFTRLLVGLVLALVLVVAVVLAATQLGSFGDRTATGDANAGSTASAEPTSPSATGEASGQPSENTVKPVAARVTRLVPGNPDLDAPNDPSLSSILDGNPATFWGSYVYANEQFGGLAENMALVVELKEPSTVSKVTIDQLNGSGGTFSVLLNDQPTLEGANQVAQNGFTGPSVSIPVTGDAESRTAKYVIINFTQLPRLSNVEAQFPWGLRIAEIRIS